jgi:hypothetical protein
MSEAKIGGHAAACGNVEVWGGGGVGANHELRELVAELLELTLRLRAVGRVVVVRAPPTQLRHLVAHSVRRAGETLRAAKTPHR